MIYDAAMIDLCLIVPHPDDEVFGSGGLFSKMARYGRRVATITLTRGGAGRTLDICSREELPAVREAELRASLAVLGVDEIHIFDHPDFVTAGDRGLAPRPGLQGVPEDDILPKLQALIERLAPRVILTFPPNGANGHPDHTTTNRLVLSALERCSHQPKELYYFAPDRPYQGPFPTGFLSTAEIARLHLPATHVVEVGPFIENKLRALAQHQTQARSVLSFMKSFPRRLLFETFHQVRPGVPADEGARTVPWL